MFGTPERERDACATRSVRTNTSEPPCAEEGRAILTEKPLNRPACGDGGGPLELVGGDRRRVEAEGVEDGRGDVVGAERVVLGKGAVLVGAAVDLAAADATAGHEDRLTRRPVI